MLLCDVVETCVLSKHRIDTLDGVSLPGKEVMVVLGADVSVVHVWFSGYGSHSVLLSLHAYTLTSYEEGPRPERKGREG